MTDDERRAPTAWTRLPWRRVLRWAALGGALSWSVLAYALHLYGSGRRPTQGQWDGIVVLGSRVFPGGQPGTAMTARVKLAAELFHEGWAPTLVLTGGVGDAGVAESEIAADLAEQLGVPREAMVLERSSTSTESNARFAAQVFAGTRVLVVTDAYHVLRSERVFARYFEQARGVGAINPKWWPTVRGALREVAALAGYAVQGRL